MLRINIYIHIYANICFYANSVLECSVLKFDINFQTADKDKDCQLIEEEKICPCPFENTLYIHIYILILLMNV